MKQSLNLATLANTAAVIADGDIDQATLALYEEMITPATPEAVTSRKVKSPKAKKAAVKGVDFEKMLEDRKGTILPAPVKEESVMETTITAPTNITNVLAAAIQTSPAPLKAKVIELGENKLFALGDLDILISHPLVLGLISTSANSHGKKFAHKAFMQLARKNNLLIGDISRPEDRLIIDITLATGGQVVVFSPTGLKQVTKLSEYAQYRQNIVDGNLLILSLSADSVWTMEEAARRNAIMVNLCAKVLVPQIISSYREGKGWGGGVMPAIEIAAKVGKDIFIPEWQLGDSKAALVIEKLYPERVTVIVEDQDLNRMFECME